MNSGSNLVSFLLLFFKVLILNSSPINFNIENANGCKTFLMFRVCLTQNETQPSNPKERQETSRQMTVAMDTQNLNVYDGILLSGSPSLTVWTSYNTRGEKTFGIDVTEYVISFIER